LQDDEDNATTCVTPVTVLTRARGSNLLDQGNSFAVRLDGLQIAKAETLLEALMSAFALHYVFYVEYCKELKNFYYFLDGHVLGLDKRMSKPPVVVQKKLNILE